MPDTNREIQELLVDYASSLRDGYVPTFLKSLSREEALRISTSQQFRDTAEVVRILNGVGFADKAVTPNVDLFISRVGAKISSRLKKAGAASFSKRRNGGRSIDRIEKRTENSI